MSGNMDMNGGEGSGRMEVCGCAVSLEEITEQSSKEVALEIASSSSGTVIAKKQSKRRHHPNMHIDHFCFSFIGRLPPPYVGIFANFKYPHMEM